MSDFQDILKRKMDEYVGFVYCITKKFPKEEIFGSTSQFRRATLSIILNYVEGYARKKTLTQLNFLETAYGSFKESKYLLYFSFKQNYINKDEYRSGLKIAEEIGAMLWTEIDSLGKTVKN